MLRMKNETEKEVKGVRKGKRKESSKVRILETILENLLTLDD